MRKIISCFLVAALTSLAGVTACTSTEVQAPLTDTTFDNLVAVPKATVDSAYVDPEADFSLYQRVSIEEVSVAFRKHWQRDQNRTRTRRIDDEDVNKIKGEVATLFEEVFTEQLAAAGYAVVADSASDVLLLKPSIIDLDIYAPDTMEPARTRSFTTDTGRATLYLELFDSVSGKILGRATDRRIIRNSSGAGHLSWSNSVTNRAEARRAFARWADKLVAFLNNHYK